MDEQELRQWFAATVPEEVPVAVDLHHRARAAGRRRRRHRTVLTAGGAGITVAGVVVAAVAAGLGDAGAGRRTVDVEASSTRTAAKTATSQTTSKIQDTAPGVLAAIDAFKAALPTGFTTTKSAAWLVLTGDQDHLLSSAVPPVVSIDLDVVDPSGGAYTLEASVGVLLPPATWTCDAPSLCEDVAQPGHDLQWHLAWHGPAVQDPPADHLDLRDRSTGKNLVVTAATKDGSSLPTTSELVAVATNEGLVSALEAVDPNRRGK